MITAVPAPRLVSTLRRLMDPPARADSSDRCGACGQALPAGHRHVVDIGARRLVCACDACAASAQHGPGHIKAVPSRYVAMPRLPVSDPVWDVLDVPVGLAFFFVNSDLGRVVGFYPGPAGATQSMLPFEAWRLLAETRPLVATMEPDVEALLVRRNDDSYECYLVPIDACYELAGRVRTAWSGLNGGDVVREQIDRFFDAIDQRAAP